MIMILWVTKWWLKWIKVSDFSKMCAHFYTVSVQESQQIQGPFINTVKDPKIFDQSLGL